MIDTEKLAHALPINDYGKGKAKSFQQLLDEIRNGETEIVWSDNKPIRLLRIVFVRVCYQNKILIEERQEFPDGRIRFRGHEVVSEKLLPQEEPDRAVYRALHEELGFPLEELQNLPIKFGGQELNKKESPSYPGLESHYDIYNYEIHISDNLYKPEYIEFSKNGQKLAFLGSNHSTQAG